MRPMPELKVEEAPTDSLVPYANNAKLHSNEQVDQICNSIEEFGFNDPIAVWDNAQGETEIVEGHGRVLAAQKLGLANVPIVRLDHLTDEQRRAYTHVHNQLTLNTGLDFDKLDKDLAELDYDWQALGFDQAGDFDDSCEKGSILQDRYNQEGLRSEIYEPSEVHRSPDELFERSMDYSDEIEVLKAPDKIKELLRIRNDWLVDLKYGKIADYYCNQATAQEQRLFEKMALVLLDKDQIIENGFSDLYEDIFAEVEND